MSKNNEQAGDVLASTAAIVKLSDNEIKDLKKSGYIVMCFNDNTPSLYGWHHPVSGASQLNEKDRQPFRLSKEQAWSDCNDYFNGEIPSLAKPDWKK